MNPRTSKTLRRLTAGAAGFMIWLMGWQWATTSGPLAGINGIPTMTQAIGKAFTQVGDPTFWESIGVTLATALAGLLIALVIGTVAGVLTALYRPVNEAVDPTIQFLRPLPAVVILPLALLIFGPTLELGVFLAAFGAVWPILVQVQVGIRDVDPVAIDTSRAMTLPWLKTQTSVVLPSAAPHIMTGIRIAASAALLLAIGAGLLGGAPGLGRRILLAQEAAQSDLAFGLILWSGVIGVLFALTLNGLEKVVVRGRRPLEDFA